MEIKINKLRYRNRLNVQMGALLSLFVILVFLVVFFLISKTVIKNQTKAMISTSQNIAELATYAVSEVLKEEKEGINVLQKLIEKLSHHETVKWIEIFNKDQIIIAHTVTLP